MEDLTSKDGNELKEQPSKEPDESSKIEDEGEDNVAKIEPDSENNTTSESESIVDNTTTKTENNNTIENEKIESETPKAPTIEPIDGDKAYAGDSVQFKVDGDVKEIQGLEGLDYSVNNGYLTVETNPNEATVLSPTVIDADGNSTSTASVTVNVIN